MQQASLRHHAETADPFVNEAERMVLRHLIERADAEVRWHEELAARIPQDRRGLPRRHRRPTAA